jgi:ATP-binding cassette subfamily F protein 3
LLTRDLAPDEGEIIWNKPNARAGLLRQTFVDEIDDNKTLHDELKTSLPDVEAIRNELDELQEKMQVPDLEDKELNRLVDRFNIVQETAEFLQAFDVEENIRRVLDEMGFLPEDEFTTVGSFSGGWKVRIGLCKIFLQKPDLLLLDEPTNHLDMDAVEWLEKFLANQTLPIVLVSHDREFMDRVCNRVVDTLDGVTYSYNGNYTDFLRKREMKLALWEEKWELQKKHVQELEDFIDTHRGKERLAPQLRRKKQELEDLPKSDKYVQSPPNDARRIKFQFPDPPKNNRHSGRNRGELCSVTNLKHGYGEGADSVLYDGAKFSVEPDDKIGIVGPNGSGKSTLLRLIMGFEKPSESGEVNVVDDTQTQYFSQHAADMLPLNRTVIDVAEEAADLRVGQKELTELLRRFRFVGRRVRSQISVLSGGEKARLAILLMMLQPSKLLVLDEPTNHLDVLMKETLEYAVREFKGAVVIVSHDRWFLSQTCKKVVALEDGKLNAYKGDYKTYLDFNDDIRKRVEAHYMPGSEGIQQVPMSRTEEKVSNRGVSRKTEMKLRKQGRRRSRSRF